MNDDSKFWISISAIFAVLIISIVYFSTAYWKDHNAKIVKMVGDGINPVSAMCALQDDYGKMPVCLVLAAKMESKDISIKAGE
tara:strand:- start:17 stop:265 length:249 start_codon:yes stop_codon:yes gene_type:complete